MPLEDTGWRVVAYSEGSGSFASVLTGTSLTVAFSSDGPHLRQRAAATFTTDGATAVELEAQRPG
jgi:hypothetical protein